MQDIYNDISSSESDEEVPTTDTPTKAGVMPQTPPKQLTQEERQALEELYQDDQKVISTKIDDQKA